MGNRKILLIIIIVIAVLGIVAIQYRDCNKNITSNKIDISDISIPDRECKYIYEEMLVGNNEKELDNGFFDIKFGTKDNEIYIMLNKLWYTTCDESYVQDEYLAKICRIAAKKINLNEDSNDLEYELYKYIKENFANTKLGNPPNKYESEDVQISMENVDGMCKCAIKRVD